MRIFVRLLTFVSLLALAPLMFGCRNVPDDTECTPTYRVVTEDDGEGIELLSGLGFSVAVIGCRSQLESLSQAEMATLTVYFQGLLHERHFAILDLRESTEFRLNVTAEINALLRREVISDVYISQFWYSESRPPVKSDD